MSNPSVARRLAFAAPLAASSLTLVALALNGWFECRDTPCIVIYMMMLTPIALLQAAMGLTLGWLVTSNDRVLRWSARALGACLLALQIYLLVCFPWP
jgi:hypothetical protein